MEASNHGSKKRERRHFTGQQKVAIAKQHLVDGVAVSDLCDNCRIHDEKKQAMKPVEAFVGLDVRKETIVVDLTDEIQKAISSAPPSSANGCPNGIVAMDLLAASGLLPFNGDTWWFSYGIIHVAPPNTCDL